MASSPSEGATSAGDAGPRPPRPRHRAGVALVSAMRWAAARSARAATAGGARALRTLLPPRTAIAEGGDRNAARGGAAPGTATSASRAVRVFILLLPRLNLPERPPSVSPYEATRARPPHSPRRPQHAPPRRPEMAHKDPIRAPNGPQTRENVPLLEMEERSLAGLRGLLGGRSGASETAQNSSPRAPKEYFWAQNRPSPAPPRGRSFPSPSAPSLRRCAKNRIAPLRADRGLGRAVREGHA
eukprot:scaffold2645_cov378-Prasinococcus_capsulatus_cf.AAC.7